MSKRALILFFVPFLILDLTASWAFADRLPPYPRAKTREAHSLTAHQKAQRLFYLAQGENPKLAWNDCLARKARRRAKQMARAGYFDHRDPATGVNPVWNLVMTCFTHTCAGENLSRGYQSPEETHRGFMASPTHRKNIENRNFSVLGVGCYDYICVELFAGF